jgi:hypothetical protein
MKEGIYKDHIPEHLDFIDPINSGLLEEILSKNYDQLSNLELSQGMRNELLDFILKFFSIHIDGISRLKSFLVLKELFSRDTL